MWTRRYAPSLQQINAAPSLPLAQITERVIREEVCREAGEAEDVSAAKNSLKGWPAARSSVFASQALGPDEPNEAIEERERKHARRMHAMKKKASTLEDLLAAAKQQLVGEELARLAELRALRQLLQENAKP